MKAHFYLITVLAALMGGQTVNAQLFGREPEVAPSKPLHLRGVKFVLPAPRPQFLDLIPTYPVENLKTALEFYTTKLGFIVVLQNGNYSAVGRDFVQIGLAQFKGAGKEAKSSSYVKMKNIDIFYKELTERGVKMAQEIKTQPSEMREFAVIDPDGNTLTFGQYMGPK